MSPGWTAVIGVSLALMAVVQLAVVIGLFIALRRTQTQLDALQGRVESVINEMRPEVAGLLDQARRATASLQALASDVTERIGAVDDATRNVKDRVARVADTVHWAATNLPMPVRVSGPAAVATWAGLRIGRVLIDRMKRRSSSSDAPALRAPTDYPPP